MTVFIVLAIIFIFTGFMLFRALRLNRAPEPVAKIEKNHTDKNKVSQHLSEAIQIRTISRPEMVEADYEPFLKIHDWIDRTYPQFTAALEKTVVNQYSLLYKWTGTDSKLSPVLLNAHLDVVPVDESSIGEWKVAPFEGVIRDGFVWGRGALDMKCNLVSILDCVEQMLGEGFTPKRTVYFAFGHDEEVSGFEGSLNIVKHLKSKGVKLAALLDEGGMVSLGALKGVDSPLALIGHTEKGYLTLRLSTESEPGHSSRPPRQTAVGIISRAIALIEDHPFPGKVSHFLPTLRKIGHVLPFKLQFAVANADILAPLIEKELSNERDTSALIRTTQAATILHGGIKDNILPSYAEAKINLRLMPGDTIAGVIERYKKIINDPRIKIEPDNDHSAWEASSVADLNAPPYRTLELVVRQIFDDVPTAPFVFLAATDSRHYQPICSQIFKFSPYLITPEGRSGVHGLNERIDQDELAGMVAFYYRLLHVWGEAEF